MGTGNPPNIQKINPQIKEIVKQSMKCALDGIENRKNSHELYGYDFMVDTDYRVWLIEINSSPSMDYSTVLLSHQARHHQARQRTTPRHRQGHR